AALLYTTVNVTAFKDDSAKSPQVGTARVVFAGYRFVGEDLAQVLPHRVVNPVEGVILDADTCDVGEHVASQLRLRWGASLDWKVGGETWNCLVSEVQGFGSAEDNQVFIPIESVQKITGLSNRATLIQLNVPGTPPQVSTYIAALQKQFPDLDVRP